MLATSAFKDYALSWWVQIQKEWSRFGLKPIDTWERLKSAMRLSYAPKAYHQTDHNKVQSRSKLSQIIEDFEKALQYESTRRKRELEIMSETLVSREVLSETLMSEENTLSGTTLSESALSENTMSANTMSEIQSEIKDDVVSRQPLYLPSCGEFYVITDHTNYNNCLSIFVQQFLQGVGQIFPQEMISVIPHTNQRVELEEVSWRERLKKIAFEPGDEDAYVRGPKQFKKIVFDPGDGDEAIHYVNKVKMKRIVFDPGGDDRLNLRSNSLQEGGDDETQGVTQLFEELVLYFATFQKA
ncbi:hypothetical protein Lal_00043534 [Lupinus albus]|nr:hypothetical protein Lal_00043534 [Lupinus albus]